MSFNQKPQLDNIDFDNVPLNPPPLLPDPEQDGLFYIILDINTDHVEEADYKYYPEKELFVVFCQWAKDAPHDEVEAYPFLVEVDGLKKVVQSIQKLNIAPASLLPDK